MGMVIPTRLTSGVRNNVLESNPVRCVPYPKRRKMKRDFSLSRYAKPLRRKIQDYGATRESHLPKPEHRILPCLTTQRCGRRTATLTLLGLVVIRRTA